jgi:hypothetical protein
MAIGKFIIDLHWYPNMRCLDLFSFLRSGATQAGRCPYKQVLPPPLGFWINSRGIDNEGSRLTTASGFELGEDGLPSQLKGGGVLFLSPKDHNKQHGATKTEARVLLSLLTTASQVLSPWVFFRLSACLLSLITLASSNPTRAQSGIQPSPAIFG